MVIKQKQITNEQLLKRPPRLKQQIYQRRQKTKDKVKVETLHRTEKTNDTNITERKSQKKEMIKLQKTKKYQN